MAFDDDTLRDLVTLALGFDIVASNVCGVARLLLAREFSALLLATGHPDGSHFALLDAQPFDSFDLVTDLPKIDSSDGRDSVGGKAVPSARGIGAMAYLNWRGILRFGGPYQPFVGSLTIPDSYKDPQLSSDAAILLALTGSVIAGPLAGIRAMVQGRIDFVNSYKRGHDCYAIMIASAPVAPGAAVPLVLERQIPPPPGGPGPFYTLSGGVLSVPAAGSFALRAWGFCKSSSTSPHLTLQIGLVIDGAEIIATGVRESADPSVPVAWEFFFLSTTINAGIELLNASSVAVTVEGEINMKRLP
ncbi:MAG TPA: hypothetical protein VH062_10225 [Polyangiaceae bacterium]|jgi:hypothetical protein|nr:hypothetical protein [Polyangiaceae bacterium]